MNIKALQFSAVSSGTVPTLFHHLVVGKTSTKSKVVSAHRASTFSPAKISAFVIVLDNLFSQASSYGVKVIGDYVYVEFSKDISPLPVLIKKGAILPVTTASESLSNIEYLTAYFLFELLKGENEEVKQLFKEIAVQYASTGTISPNEEYAAFKLMDSIYYGCPPEIDIADASLAVTPQEIEAIARAKGCYTPKELLYIDTFDTVQLFVTARDDVSSEGEVEIEDPDKILNAAKRGEYIIPYKWKPAQSEYIEDLSSLDDYIPNETFDNLLTKVSYRLNRILSRMGEDWEDTPQNRVKAIGGDYVNITLSGNPGTGKTKLAHILGASTGLPVYVVPLSKNTDESEFLGICTMVDGKPTNVLTDTMRCAMDGGILILEEVSLCDPGVLMGTLSQFTEAPFILKKDGYIPVRRHPLCVVISTMNVGTAGSRTVNQAFANRFKQSFVMDDPEKDTFVRILMNSGESRDVCTWVYDCYTALRNRVQDNTLADTESILLALSMRSCFGAIENMQEGMKPKKAIEHSIIGKIAEQDKDVAMDCMSTLESFREL